MMGEKLQIVRLYKADDVPDHIVQEVADLTQDLLDAFKECKKKYSNPAILLSAFNRIHAMMIMDMITEEGLQDAVCTEMIGLMKNVEHLSGRTFEMGEKIE